MSQTNEVIKDLDESKKILNTFVGYTYKLETDMSNYPKGEWVNRISITDKEFLQGLSI
jgi:hypothetical protein